MGNSTKIADIRGLEAWTEAGAQPGRPDLASWLCTGLDDGPREVADEKAAKLVKAIRALPNGDKITGIMADRRSKSGAIGIGWGDFALATPDAILSLAKLLKKAGMNIKRLENDRFLWYG